MAQFKGDFDDGRGSRENVLYVKANGKSLRVTNHATCGKFTGVSKTAVSLNSHHKVVVQSKMNSGVDPNQCGMGRYVAEMWTTVYAS